MASSSTPSKPAFSQSGNSMVTPCDPLADDVENTIANFSNKPPPHINQPKRNYSSKSQPVGSNEFVATFFQEALGKSTHSLILFPTQLPSSASLLPVPSTRLPSPRFRGSLLPGGHQSNRTGPMTRAPCRSRRHPPSSHQLPCQAHRNAPSMPIDYTYPLPRVDSAFLTHTRGLSQISSSLWLVPSDQPPLASASRVKKDEPNVMLPLSIAHHY